MRGRVVIKHWLDDSRMPTFVQVFPAFYTDEELFAAFDHLDAMVLEASKRPGHFSLISDVSRARVGSAVHRRRIARTFVTTQRVLGSGVAGQAFVMRSRVQRGALTAILWLARPPWPIEVFGTLEEALAWLRARHAELR